MEILLYDDEKTTLTKALLSIPDDGTIVEWGSGGSTEWWLNRMTPTQSLISIEHNEEWVEKVLRELKDHPNRKQLTYVYAKPQYSLEFYGYASPVEENPAGLRMYIFPNELNKRLSSADLFFVDGIARGAVLSAIRGCLNPTYETDKCPLVFLHDYVGRETWYGWAIDLFRWHTVVGTTLVKMGN